MVPRILRTAVGFGGGFLAIWMVYNIQPRWLGIVSGILTFVVAVIAMNIVSALFAQPRKPGASRDPGAPPSSTS